MKLSIVIVHYNTLDLLKRCLRSIYAQEYNFQFEVFVVDNASKCFEGIESSFPLARVIRNKSNLGFSKANNQGLKSAAGEYILFLNPDTEVLKGSIEKMIGFLESNPDVGVVGPKLVYPDGSLQLSCRKFYTLRAILMRRLPFTSRLFNRKILLDHLMLDDKSESMKDPDWLIAACVMLPKRVLDKIGGFDEGYKLYFEDVDLCYRIKKEGLRVAYYSESTVIHHHRRDSAKGFSKKTIWHLLSAARFFRKYGWSF